MLYFFYIINYYLHVSINNHEIYIIIIPKGRKALYFLHSFIYSIKTVHPFSPIPMLIKTPLKYKNPPDKPF